MAHLYDRDVPKGTRRITTGCQYCAVGCGYSALLTPEHANPHDTFRVQCTSKFITPAMQSTVNFKGMKFEAAVAPDRRCHLNRGNHSVRGGSQGMNLVTHDGGGRSTQDRLRSPMVRLSNGAWHPITWRVLNQVMAKLLVQTTHMEATPDGQKVRVAHPERLGVKLYEYQYLENTFAATKLFYSFIGTPNVAYHDRPSAAGSSPGLQDVGFRPHDFAYDDIKNVDLILFIGTNPYENQSVFFMDYCTGKQMIVMDPRRTATAQHAEQENGLHLQPTRLGADSLVLYAMAREVIRRWIDAEPARVLADFPLRPEIATSSDCVPVSDVPQREQGEAEVELWQRRRRASRTSGFIEFATKFLKVDDPESLYTLGNAAAQSGIKLSKLEAAVSLLADPSKAILSEQPKVAILYEKGMIWGFNYHNTAAVGSLGLLLGAYRDSGRLVGRVGGHQKGWAESQQALPFVVGSKDEGYPFRNVTDRYKDVHLEALQQRRSEVDQRWIKVHHNLDNHVFGPLETFVDDREGAQDDLDIPLQPVKFVKLKNGLITKSSPDVRLLWIVGNNYLGQTNEAALKRVKLADRMANGSQPVESTRPEPPANAQPLSVNAIIDALGKRIENGGLVLVHQEVMPNPTTMYCDIIIPAAGWGEDDFIRYNAQRRLKLYARFQDSPLYEDDRRRIASTTDPDPVAHIDDLDVYQHSPKPDWRIFRALYRTKNQNSGYS